MHNGINYKEFDCFKFRSLKGKQKELEFNQVIKNDKRHTKIGRFLRKTSIDELPQFYNVFIGISVVGPRPHMLSYTKVRKKIDKYSYMFRHSVKPGITGLAQVNGYRGEIKDDDDIIGHVVKYDIFYIENWSLLLDLKIIIQTIIKAIKGDEKSILTNERFSIRIGREHTFAWKIAQSPLCANLYVAPGNTGTSSVATNLDISVTDFEGIKSAVLNHNIEMVVVGPEDPLVNGVHDFFLNDDALKHVAIGPQKVAATLEGSKEFAKEFLFRHNIPTAAYQSFTASDLEKGFLF